MNQRVDEFVSWLAASILVTAAVVFVINREQAGRRPKPVVADPSPAQEPLEVQQARALERGRGRRAAAPFAIPWRGWQDILKRVYYKIQNDRVLALAASVVFYSLVAL